MKLIFINESNILLSPFSLFCMLVCTVQVTRLPLVARGTRWYARRSWPAHETSIPPSHSTSCPPWEAAPPITHTHFTHTDPEFTCTIFKPGQLMNFDVCRHLGCFHLRSFLLPKVLWTLSVIYVMMSAPSLCFDSSNISAAKWNVKRFVWYYNRDKSPWLGALIHFNNPDTFTSPLCFECYILRDGNEGKDAWISLYAPTAQVKTKKLKVTLLYFKTKLAVRINLLWGEILPLYFRERIWGIFSLTLAQLEIYIHAPLIPFDLTVC